MNEIVNESFELRTGEFQCKMLRARRIGRDVGQVDFGLGCRGKLDLGLFGCFLEALQSELVLFQVNALLLLELVCQILDETHVEIFTAEEGVTVGGLHFEHAIPDFKDGHVERAAAEIVNGDCACLALIEAVSECRRRRLIDDAQNFEAGNLAGILGCLTLGVIEIGRNRDDGLGYFLT